MAAPASGETAGPNGVFAPLPEPLEVDQAKAELGRMLFFDERLSGDTDRSCASCHDPAQSWGDGQTLSEGYTGVSYFRNSPPLFNAAHHTYPDVRRPPRRRRPRHLGPRHEHRGALHEHGFAPHAGAPQAGAGVRAALRGGLQGNDPYGDKIYGAVAEFLREIRTENAPFDSYLRGDEAALTKQQRRGMELFAGKAGCAACHKGAMLSDGALHVTGVPENADIEGSADRQISILRHFATTGVPNYMNRRVHVGHYVVSKDDRDLGAFKTPSSAA